MMWRIRREQMRIMQRAARVAFAEKVVAYLRKNAAEATEPKTDEDLLEFVQECIDAAASHGVTCEWDVCRYAQHRCVLGDDFANSDWAAPIFSDPELDGSEKMDRVEFLALYVVGTDGKKQAP